MRCFGELFEYLSFDQVGWGVSWVTPTFSSPYWSLHMGSYFQQFLILNSTFRMTLYAGTGRMTLYAGTGCMTLYAGTGCIIYGFVGQ